MIRDISYEQFEKDIKNYQHEYRENCKIQKAIDLLSGKWTIHVLYELIKKDSIRFGELKKLIPSITNTMLASTLKELEKNNLINRIQYNEIPPHVEYLVTKDGKALLPVFFELIKWSELYYSEIVKSKKENI